METLYNSKPIQEIVDTLPNIKDKIDKTTNEMNNYFEYLKKDERFEEKENETEEFAIKRAEGIFDRLDEIVRRRKLMMENGKEIIYLLDSVRLKIESVVKSCENDGIHLANANVELINKIKDLEERKRIRDITPLQQQIDEINNKSNKKIQELDILKKPHEEFKKNKEQETRKEREQEERKKQEEEVMKKTNNTIGNNEIQQIEKWSGMKIGNIIFDSDIDNWNDNTSVFDQKIMNKSNLIFIIEDDSGNKFGGYINAKIDKCNAWVTDPKAFVFSLKSNGILDGMFKFDITYPQNAFYLYGQSDDYLFLIGGNDIWVYKENDKNGSYCYQRSFNYNGIQNALCGIENFTPKRIKVIQLKFNSFY